MLGKPHKTLVVLSALVLLVMVMPFVSFEVGRLTRCAPPKPTGRVWDFVARSPANILSLRICDGTRLDNPFAPGVDTEFGVLVPGMPNSVLNPTISKCLKRLQDNTDDQLLVRLTKVTAPVIKRLRIREVYGLSDGCLPTDLRQGTIRVYYGSDDAHPNATLIYLIEANVSG